MTHEVSFEIWQLVHDDQLPLDSSNADMKASCPVPRMCSFLEAKLSIGVLYGIIDRVWKTFIASGTWLWRGHSQKLWQWEKKKQSLQFSFLHCNHFLNILNVSFDWRATKLLDCHNLHLRWRLRNCKRFISLHQSKQLLMELTKKWLNCLLTTRGSWHDGDHRVFLCYKKLLNGLLWKQSYLEIFHRSRGYRRSGMYKSEGRIARWLK